MGKNVLSDAKHFPCSCHATWLPCKTSIDQMRFPPPPLLGFSANNIEGVGQAEFHRNTLQGATEGGQPEH